MIELRSGEILILLCSIFVITYFLIRILIPIFFKLGMRSRSNPIVKNQVNEVVYGGGIVIGFVLIILISFLCIADFFPYYFLAGFVPIYLVGIFDDNLNFVPSTKLILQTVGTLGFILVFKPEQTYYPLIIFFLLASQNSWNLIDVMDGLTGLVSIISFITIGIILTITGYPYSSLTLLCYAIAASTGGFFIWNLHPAKIYLGDCGSLSLGMLWGMIVLEIFFYNVLTGILLLSSGVVPFFELIFLIWVRTKKGIPFYRGSADHFAMRLLYNGFDVNTINKKMALMSITSSIFAIAIALIGIELYKILIFAGVLILAAFQFFKYLYQLKVYDINNG